MYLHKIPVSYDLGGHIIHSLQKKTQILYIIIRMITYFILQTWKAWRIKAIAVNSYPRTASIIRKLGFMST